jgi:hypothetical protein
MRLNNGICISFLQDSGWLQRHDKILTMCAKDTVIDKFARKIKKELENNAIYNMDAINTIVWQLKEEILSGEECLTKNVGEIDEK